MNLCTPIHQFQKSFNEISVESQIYFTFFERRLQNTPLFNRRQRTKINHIRRRQRDEKDPRLFNADK
ncbi:hypothetical protein A4U88_1851 [Serratia marcescens]|nr:hypothetical protein A4U88_1851 [Serratia marcescens]